ncbi:MAG: YfhO family protein [Deltaproteobacteria bacterium]|nr:YfhO family protein [Deltaproteobacteria bacterium]
MRRLAAIALIAALAARPQLLLGPVSADDHLSVHHAFQSEPGGRVRHPQLSDPAVQLKALRRAVVAELRAGRAPLWNPQIYGGAPLLADMQSRPMSWVTWLFVFGEGIVPDGVLVNLGHLITLMVLAAGSALLARRWGQSSLASGLVALGAASSPYVSVWLQHPHATTFALWPWLALGVEALRAGGGPLPLAFAAALLIFGGHPETAAHGLILTGVLAACRLRSRRAWLGLLGGLTLGALLSAPIWAPFLEQLARSATLSAHGGNRLSPGTLVELLWPGWLGHPATEAGYRGPGAWAESQLHPGLGIMALAIFALRTTQGRALWSVWALCLGAALLGGPVLNQSRLGVEAALILSFAAGFGLDGLRAQLPKLAPARLAAALGLLVALTGASARARDQHALPWAEHDPAPAPWTQALKEAVGEGRVVGLGWALQPNTGALVGLRDLRGYDLPVSRDTERLMAGLDRRVARPWFPIEALSPESTRLLRFAGVRVVLWAGEGSPPPILGALPEVSLPTAPLRAYWLDAEAPRAWLASATTQAPDAEAALRQVLLGQASRARPTVEAEPIHGVPAPPTPIPVTQDGGATLQLRLLGAPGLAVITEAWSPGWEAVVDGVERPILRVGGAFLGVPVAAGEAKLTLRYRPRGFTLGLGLLSLGLLSVLGLVLLDFSARRGHKGS